MRMFDPEIFTAGFRKDGWPYCPDCERDELYLSFDDNLKCYFCGFNENAAPNHPFHRDQLKPDQPCSHPGCLHHRTHPCEGCGRTAGR